MSLDKELVQLREVVGTIDLPFEGKSLAASDGSVYVEGLAAGLGRDRVGERFTAGALEAALTQYMRNPILLWSHDMTAPLGEVVEAHMVPRGLWIKAKVTEPSPSSPLRDIWAKVKAGVVRGLSVGGKFFRSPDGTITGLDLAEISLAPVPMNPETLCQVVAGKAWSVDTDLDTELERLAALGRNTLDADLAALRRLA